MLAITYKVGIDVPIQNYKQKSKEAKISSRIKTEFEQYCRLFSLCYVEQDSDWVYYLYTDNKDTKNQLLKLKKWNSANYWWHELQCIINWLNISDRKTIEVKSKKEIFEQINIFKSKPLSQMKTSRYNFWLEIENILNEIYKILDSKIN